MKTWPGWRMRKARSSNALGLTGTGSTVAQEAVAGQVDLDRAEVDERPAAASDARRCSRRRKRARIARGQLAQAERLRDVVVGAELEPDDLVELASLAVSMMIGTPDSARMIRQTSMPDSSGSIRSSRTRSGRSARKRASASRPSAAVTTR